MNTTRSIFCKLTFLILLSLAAGACKSGGGEPAPAPENTDTPDSSDQGSDPEVDPAPNDDPKNKVEVENFSLIQQNPFDLFLRYDLPSGSSPSILFASVIGSTPPADCAGGQLIHHSSSGTKFLSHNKLSVQTTFSLRICTVIDGLNSAGVTLTGTTIVEALAATPSNLSVPDVTVGSLTLSFDSGGGTTNDFLIVLKEGNVAPSSCAANDSIQLPIASSPATVVGLKDNTNYSFLICSRNVSQVDTSGPSISKKTEESFVEVAFLTGDPEGKNQHGVYGVQGVASSTNNPGALIFTMTATDNSDNLWLFGGFGEGGDTSIIGDKVHNHLWKYDGTNWTWVHGSDIGSVDPTHGTKGVTQASNDPGSRSRGAMWVDGSNNIWIFSGFKRNDLWKFDGTNWTWVKGESFEHSSSGNGVFGVQGVGASANSPGARRKASYFTDSSGNLWLFGGTSIFGERFNDLWKFNGTHWIWVSGANTHSPSQSSVFGTQGIAATSNQPGGRHSTAMWIDSSDNVWVFGGVGPDENGNIGRLNDLWKFDGSDWTWVDGTKLRNQSPIYGTRGTAAASNQPAGSEGQMGTAVGTNNELYLYLGAENFGSRKHDYWKYQSGQWTLSAGGDNYIVRNGEQGVLSSTNYPSKGLQGGWWGDSSGQFYLFGGSRFRTELNLFATGNDLWKLRER